MVWQLDRVENNCEWDKFISQADLVTIAHNPSLIDFFSSYFGFDGGNYFLKRNGERKAAIVLIDTGSEIISVPHLSYGGFLTTGDTDEDECFHAVDDLLGRKLQIRSFKKLSEYCYDKKIAAYLKLEQNADLQFAKLTPNMRRKTRKAARNGLEIRIGGVELTEQFYYVYRQNMKRLGSPQFSGGFFRALLENYSEGEAKIFCVYYNDKVIGGAYVLSYKGFFENCWLSTDHRYNNMYTSLFLYWQMIQYAVEQKYSYFSFGRSSQNSSLLEFKRNWKPEERRLYFNYSYPHKVQLRDQDYLSKCWMHMPSIVTDIIGPKIAEKLF